MRVLLGTALGGLMLAATTLPAAAGEPLRLTDDHLDQVTAGATAFLLLAGQASAFGNTISASEVIGTTSGVGNDRYTVASGHVLALAIGAATNGQAEATTGGIAAGDYTFVRTVNVRGGSATVGRFAGSGTVGVALSLAPL